MGSGTVAESVVVVVPAGVEAAAVATVMVGLRESAAQS